MQKKHIVGTAEHGHEDEESQRHEDHDPVLVCPAFLGLCAFTPLSLLPDLSGLSCRRDV